MTYDFILEKEYYWDEDYTQGQSGLRIEYSNTSDFSNTKIAKPTRIPSLKDYKYGRKKINTKLCSPWSNIYDYIEQCKQSEIRNKHPKQ